MVKDKNELGVDFGEMMESDFLIDTDTGKLVSNNNVPDDKPTETEEVATETIQVPDEETIEVNVEPHTSSDTPAANKANVSASSSSDSNKNVLKSLAKALYDEGVISELDEESLASAEESEAEILIKLIGKEINKNVDSYKENLPSKIKKVIDNYEEGVPLDVIIGLESTNDRLDTIDEETLSGDDNLQKVIVADGLRREGLSEAKIAKRIQQFDDLNQLEDEAKDMLAETKQYYAEALEKEKVLVTKQREENEKVQKKTLEDLKKAVMSATEFVPGIKITTKEKEKIYDSMTKVVGQDKQKNPMNNVMMTRAKNPMAFEQLLHYYHNLGLFNMDDDGNPKPDISKLKTGAKSNAIDELNKSLKAGSPAFAGAPAKERLDSDKMRENLNAMKGLF